MQYIFRSLFWHGLDKNNRSNLGKSHMSSVELRVLEQTSLIGRKHSHRSTTTLLTRANTSRATAQGCDRYVRANPTADTCLRASYPITSRYDRQHASTLID